MGSNPTYYFWSALWCVQKRPDYMGVFYIPMCDGISESSHGVEDKMKITVPHYSIVEIDLQGCIIISTSNGPFFDLRGMQVVWKITSKVPHSEIKTDWNQHVIMKDEIDSNIFVISEDDKSELISLIRNFIYQKRLKNTGGSSYFPNPK